MIHVPEYISSIKPYVPGKPVEELEREIGISNSVKLASNENPAGPSKLALAALQSGITEGLNRYPDGGGYYLRHALAGTLNVKFNQVMLGNGSNELLDIAVKTFMQPGDEAVMAWPSFVVYPLAVQAQGCEGIKVPLQDFRHDLDTMADAVSEKTRIVFIANPNNPTGTINTADEFDRFMERIPEDILVIVDEAYYEYVSDKTYADSMKHLKAGRNLLILRTFSKIHGLAGLRIGYGISRPEILEEMNKLREPFNTNSLAQATARAAIDDKAHIEYSKQINMDGKLYLYRELDSLGVKYVPTEANFIFMIPGMHAEKVYDGLLKRGVIVRPMGEQALRVTIGLPEENAKFIEELKAVLKVKKKGK
jgi:histidinol-phosphate aminotransferase